MIETFAEWKKAYQAKNPSKHIPTWIFNLAEDAWKEAIQVGYRNGYSKGYDAAEYNDNGEK